MSNERRAMRKRIFSAFSGVVISLLIAHRPSLWAAFEDTGTGARQTALGAASVAAADDVFSLMVNPAGLARIRRQEAGADYSRLYMGLSDGSMISQSFLGYARPVQWGGTLAAGWSRFGVSGLYSERTLSVGYGEWITSRVAAGIAVKQLHHGFEPPSLSVDDSGTAQSASPSFFAQNGASRNAYSADIGFLIKASPRHTVGVSVQDLNEPDIALSSNDHEIVPKTWRLGLAYEMPRQLKLMAGLSRRQNLSNRQETTWTGAAEREWKLSELRSLAARGSLSSAPRQFQQMVLGAGYRTGALVFDYAFQFNFSGVVLGDTAGTHRLSLRYSFGPSSEMFTRRGADGKLKRGRAERKDDIEQWLGVGTEKVDAPVPEAETRKTADMMVKTPPAERRVSTEYQTGPGLQVQVPAPVTSVTAVTEAEPNLPSAPPVMVKKAPAVVRPVARLELFDLVSRMSDVFKQKISANAAADDRLATLRPLFAALRGYNQSRIAEVSEVMATGERLDQAELDLERMNWEGAAAADRLALQIAALESVFGPALTERSWELTTDNERAYKAWAESAQTAVRQMGLLNAGAELRLEFAGQAAKKALDYERQMKEVAVALTSVPMVIPATAGAEGGAGAGIKAGAEDAAGTEVEAGTTGKAVEPVLSTKRIEKSAQIEKSGQMKPAVSSAPDVSSAPAVLSAPAAPKAPAISKPAKAGVEGVPAVYIVKEGDTLESLAKRFYGDHKKWREIYILNQDRLGRGGVLKPGQRLVMPKPSNKESK